MMAVLPISDNLFFFHRDTCYEVCLKFVSGVHSLVTNYEIFCVTRRSDGG